MKLIIDIPEDMYNDANILIVKDLPELKKIIANGIPYKERSQGEWIDGGKDVTGQYFYDEFICSKCFVVVTDKSNFCPKCGADMRKCEVTE